MITHVAIQFNGNTYSLPKPNRHHNVIREIAKENGRGLYGPYVQGFLDNEGNFLTRKQAYIHAKECNQILYEFKTINGTLYSEDLW